MSKTWCCILWWAGLVGINTTAQAQIGMWSVPSFRQVKQAYQPSQAWLLARDGQPLHVVRINRQVQKGDWVPLRAIAPSLAYAVLLAEDKNFETHRGVDWSAALSATWSNVWHLFSTQRSRGASTITMQLVGLLEAEARQQGRRSLFEKLAQSALALRLEQNWSKPEILEAYLNLVGFRGELVGVGALSHGLFGKAPDGLDSRESALAAVLLRAPNAKAERVSQRACTLLTQQGLTRECLGLADFTALIFSRKFSENTRSLRQLVGAPQLAPHLAHKLLNQPGQRLRSSIDRGVQQFALRSLRTQLASLSQRNVQDGAVLVLHNQSGEILAWVGSSGDLSQASAVDGVLSLRQAGSTLKPFLYALAFEQKRLTAASLIEDAAYALDTGNGFYAPQNYEPHYRGWVSVRMALGASLNIPAVKTVEQIGVEPFYDRLRELGFTSLQENADWYGYSLALGSADVSLLMLANAYRTLANQGEWRPLRLTAAATHPDWNKTACAGQACATVSSPYLAQALSASAHRVYTPAVSFIVSDILADRAARVGSFGLESWLATPYWSAAKTGTSKDMRDNWCIGFSRHYTVAVWVGNASGQPMHDVSGITGAAPVWREVMDWLQRGDASMARPIVRSIRPAAPAGTVGMRIQFQTQLEPARQEWFVAGTERRSIALATQAAVAKITYPASAMVIALDPDIPPSRQKLPLSVAGQVAAGWQWRLDGQVLGPVAKVRHWLPQPGPHTLQLLDGSGTLLDSVRFDVKALKAPTNLVHTLMVPPKS